MKMNDTAKEHRGGEWRRLVTAIVVNGFLQFLGTWFAAAALVAIGNYLISGDSLVSTWKSMRLNDSKMYVLLFLGGIVYGIGHWWFSKRRVNS